MDTRQDDNPVIPLATRLRHSGLALPAWTALECARPFGWLLGQLSLVAEPTLRGLGLDPWMSQITTLLNTPERLQTLSDALAPEDAS
jgi:hypothetical protein